MVFYSQCEACLSLKHIMSLGQDLSADPDRQVPETIEAFHSVSSHPTMVGHIILGICGHFFQQTFETSNLGPAGEAMFCFVGFHQSSTELL